MRTKLVHILILLFVAFISWKPVLAQDVPGQDTATQAIGLPLNGAFSGSSFDNVQINNGNLHIEIPMYTVPGRGLSVPVSLVYDSKGWYAYTPNVVQGSPVNIYPRGWKTLCGSTGQNNMGWTLTAPMVGADGPPGAYPFVVFGLSISSSVLCSADQTSVVTYTYREPNGTSHSFPPVSSPGNQCNNWAPSSVVATDGSGYALLLNGNSSHTQTVVTKDGTQLYATYGTSGVNSYVTEDTNGNKMTRAVTSGVPASSITDTVGRSLNVGLVLNTGTGKYELKYLDSNGTQQTIQVTMTTVNVHTNLCSYQNTGSDGGCTEWVGAWQAPNIIQLPNGMTYTITYVQNSDGQISSIQLPTRGHDFVYLGQWNLPVS
jgi:hypothetical protein